MSVLHKLSDYLHLIKFSHSVFALPFAFTAALIAADGIPSMAQIFWITLAMVGGRSGAMGMNRIIDKKIDSLNPRTKDRELPRGVITSGEAFLFTLFSFAVLVLAAYQLNPLCLMLSPVVVLILFSYSYTKRFTWLCHIVLGVTLALAPLGAWIAVRGTFSMEILPLSLAILFWVAGFDALYGLQDLEFDKKHGLYSIPSRFGVKASLLIAKCLHVATVILLISLIPVFDLSYFYMTGIAAATGLLIYEHSLLKATDLSRLNMAFFNMNGYISVTVFVFTLLDYTVLK
ncbi:MAG: UbiA family prenyltransferase [Nitrospira sp.]|nr:UbiA family prenyltransferase [bacterium]MBL7048571.1 UbiA family prenyltransferase [Nitrospira sp.]